MPDVTQDVSQVTQSVSHWKDIALTFAATYGLSLAGGIIILIAERFTAFMQSSPKAMRRFDYGFAALMSAFALKLVLTQGR